jgi:hypothetical protein
MGFRIRKLFSFGRKPELRDRAFNGGGGGLDTAEFEKHCGQFSRGHSDFQVEHFIVRSQGHPFFQYKQACRELEARIESYKLANGAVPEKILSELLKFKQLADELNDYLNWDQLTESQKYELEKDAWFDKAERLIAMDLLASRGNQLTRGTVEFVLSLPGSIRKEFIKKIIDGGSEFVNKLLTE